MDVVRGYIENLTSDRVSIFSLGLTLPGLFTEEAYEEEFTSIEGVSIWEATISELQALILAGTIELRDNDNTTVISDTNVSEWVYRETTPFDSLPEVIQNSAGSLVQYTAIVGGKVAGAEAFLTHGGGIPHNESGMYLIYDCKIRGLAITVNDPDSKTYDLIIYSNPDTTPIVVVSDVLSIVNALDNVVEGLDISLTAGRYAMALRRVAGAASSSVFTSGAVSMLVDITL